MTLALFYVVHVGISFFLIGVVLLQQGKGADLSVFGGGGTMTAFGARSATNILHKMTVGAFIAYIVTTLTIGVLQRGSQGSTVMDEVAATEALPDPDEAAATAGDGTSDPADPAASPDAAPAEGDTTPATDAPGT